MREKLFVDSRKPTYPATCTSSSKVNELNGADSAEDISLKLQRIMMSNASVYDDKIYYHKYISGRAVLAISIIILYYIYIATAVYVVKQ